MTRWTERWTDRGSPMAGRAARIAAAGLFAALAACGGSQPAPTAEVEPVPTMTPAEAERSAHDALGLATPADRPTQIAVGPLAGDIEPTVREALRPRMIRHAKDLTDLYGALWAGQRDEVARLAQAIADEPQIADAAPADSANAAIPRAFFEKQTALADRARALADAAKPGGGDDAAVAAALEGLADGCAGCHGPR